MSNADPSGYTYADLHVGMAFRSPGRTITDADLVAFAGLTGDYSELHTSDVYAKSSQFGRRVAHGMLGLAYAHGLMWARTGELRQTAVAFISKVPLAGVEAS
jgi:acyl dehydratase